MGWDPLVARCKDFVSTTGILVKVCLRGLITELAYLNYYGPYLNREIFWDDAVDGGIFNHPNFLIVGDLNFTLLDVEI